MTPPPLPPDLLLAHAGALRSLAQSLLRDAHAAEDALHETYLRALEQPPASLERAGAWLRAVLESVAKKRLRGESRRARRERSSARDELVPALDLERGEMLRLVLEAVLALDEPYRELVLDRYFEELPPREIARRRSIPLNTVESRLARARARLRERLARELGGSNDWRRSLAALFGLSLPRAAALVPGAFAVTTAVKLLAASALIALAGLGWYASRAPGAVSLEAEADSAALEPEAPGAASFATAPSGARVAAGEGERTAEAAVEERAVERAAPPYRYELLVVARDGEDRPLAGANVSVAPRGARWNQAGVTDAKGELALAFRGFAPPLELALAVQPKYGGERLERRVRLAAGERTGVACVVAEEETYTLQMVGDGGDAGRSDGSTMQMRAVLVRGRPLGEEPSMASYADAAAFVEPGAVAPPRDPSPLLLSDLSRSLVTNSYGNGAMEAVGGSLQISLSGWHPAFDEAPPPDDGDAPLARGFVRNAAGHALGGVRVEARDASGEVRGGTWTNDEGEFRLTVSDASDARIALRAGGGDHGIASTDWRPALEPELRWNPVLDRGHELLGRLLGPEGAPLANWSVEVELEDANEPWSDRTRSGGDGRFSIANLPARPLRLLAREPDAHLSALVAEGVWPDLEERAFELDAAALADASLRLALTDAAGLPCDGANARVWQRASGRAFELERSADEPGLYSAKALPPGDYELEVGSPERGFTALPDFRLEPGEALDLGIAQLPAPAELSIAAGDVERELHLELWRRAEGTELLAAEIDERPEAALVLREGEYELVGRVGGAAFERRFMLRAGERVELALDGR